MKILVLFIAFLIIISSCSKTIDEDNQIEIKRISNNYNTENQLIEFNNEIELYKRDSNINLPYLSLDSSIWYIEALLNYRYAYPHLEREKMLKYKETFSIEISENGNVNFSNIIALYDYIMEFNTFTFAEINCENKFLIAVDIELDKQEGNNQILSRNVILNVYFGCSSENLNAIDNTDIEWRITGGDFNNGGNCLTMQNQNIDATHVIERALFKSNSIHKNPNVFVTDVSYSYYGCGNGVGNLNLNFNYFPCNADVLYNQFIPVSQGGSFMSCMPVNHLKNYISNILPSIDNINNLNLINGKELFIEDINWYFDLIDVTIPGAQYHHYYDYEPVIGLPHLKLNPQSQLFFQN